MVWTKALVAVWKRVPRVFNEQFVKERRSTAPMPDDEHRRLVDFRLFDFPANSQALNAQQGRIYKRTAEID